MEIFGETGNPLERARHLELAERALGIALVPETVQAKLREVEAPQLDLSWEGALVWNTAYYAGLRQHLSGTNRGPTERLSRAACNVLMANTFIETDPAMLPSARWAEKEGPRANLQRRFHSVLGRFLLAPPRPSEPTLAGRETKMDHTVLLVGPTGVGKTLVMGDYLSRIGVGAEKPDGTRRKALLITVTQQLVRDAVDPEKTLQRCLPDNATTTTIWEDHKDAASASGDLVVVTRQSLAESIEDGLIVMEDYDTVVVDEADDLTPELMELVGQFDCPKVLLTATPTLSIGRDMLRDYHFDRPMSRLEAIEQELLAPTRIITLQAADEEQAEQLAALHAARVFVARGLKAIVYCQPGGGNAQAKRIAELTTQYVQEMLGDAFDPDLRYAAMIGTANIDSPEFIAAFEAQEHGGILTTSQMCGRGWDHAPLAGAIFVGDQHSFRNLEQESGRPGRQSPGKEEAVLIEIQLPFKSGGPVRYCLAQVFGLDYVTGADIVLQPGWKAASSGAGKARFGRASPSPPPPPPPPPKGQRFSGGSSTGKGQKAPSAEYPYAPSIFLASLGIDVTEALVAQGVSIAEIIIEPARRGQYVAPPEYGVSDEELLQANPGYSLGYLQYHLGDRAGPRAVPFKRIRSLPMPGQQDGETERRYVRYYHTELLTALLTADPLPPVTDRIYSVVGMAKTLHIPESMAVLGVEELGFPPREPSRPPAGEARGAKAVPRYSSEELKALEVWTARTPEALPTDEPAVEVLALHPWALDFLGSDVRERKRHPSSGARKGVEYFLSEEAVWRIKVEDARRSGLVPLTEVATRAGVSQPKLLEALTEEERRFAFAHRNKFTPPGGTKHARQVTVEMAEAIVDRVRTRGLSPTEFTTQVYADLAGVALATARARLKDLPKTTRPLPGTRGQTTIYSVDDLGLLTAFNQPPAHIMGMLQTLRAAAAPDATPADRVAARKIQINVLGIPASQLEPLPEGDLEAAAAPRAAAPASSTLDKLRAEFQTHALHALISSFRPGKQDLMYDDAGELQDISPRLSHLVQTARKNVRSIEGEWVRLGRLAEMCGQEAGPMYELVLKTLREKGYPAQIDGRRLVLGWGQERKVELFVQLRIASDIRKIITARQAASGSS